MGREWLLLNRLFSPVAIVLRIFRWLCPSFPITITRMITSSPSRVRAARERGFYVQMLDKGRIDKLNTTNEVLELTKHLQWSYSLISTGWYRIAKSACGGVFRNPEHKIENVWPKCKSCIAKYFVKIYPDFLFQLIITSREPPGLDIAGKLIIIALWSGCDLDWKKMDATLCRRRCLLLCGAWLSHSAYDARMVNMAEGIVNHGIPEPRYVNITLRFVDCYGRGRIDGSVTQSWKVA